MIGRSLSLIFLAVAAAPLTASGQVILVPSVRWQPDPGQVPATARPVLVDRQARPIPDAAGRYTVRWDAASQNSLITVVTASIGGGLPAGYEVQPIELQIPYYLGPKTVPVVLAPSRRDGSARTAQFLFSRVVTAMSGETLMAFHQQARAAALERMALVGGNWRQLDDYTVQVVYKYLQSTLWLSKHEPRIVVRDDRLTEATEWLVDATQNRGVRVTKALGSTAMVEQLIGELKQVDGTLLVRLWGAITREPDHKRRCQLLELFRQDSAGVVVPGLHEAHTLSALASGYVDIYKNSRRTDRVVETRLRQLVQEMRAVLRIGDVPEMAERLLRSDIATINAILS